MQREYDGEPLDMTWDSGPWANDGETVEATNGDHGTMKTIEWPDGATDPEELNEDQQKVIMAAVRNPNIDSWKTLTELSGVDKTRAYSHSVLREHWPEGYENVKRQPRLNHDEYKISQHELAEMRRQALDGKSTRELSDEFGIAKSSTLCALKGTQEYGNRTCSVPPLEYDGYGSGGEWVLEDEGTKSDTDHQRPETPDEVRELLLNGYSVNKIVKEFGGSSKQYRRFAHERPDESEWEYPPLEFDDGSDQCWKPQSEIEPSVVSKNDSDSKNTDTKDKNAPESEPTLEGQTVSKQPTTPDGGLPKRTAAVVVGVTLAVVWLVKRLLP
jgi:hypothetical protein